MLLPRLMLVVHVTCDAARGRSGDRMMAGDMADDSAGNCAADTTFGFSRGADRERGRSSNGECRMKSAHL